MDAAELVRHVKLLEPKAGDVVVFEVEGPLGQEDAARLQRYLIDAFEGTGVRPIVVGGGVTLGGVIRG